MIGFLDELHVCIGVQGYDLAVVQADGGLSVLPGAHGLAAGKTYVVQQETRFPGDVEDVHGAFMAQQAHGGGIVGVLDVFRCAEGGKGKGEENQENEGG